MEKNREVEQVMERAVETLAGVRGVLGIVLGGSRARGTNGPDSDIDIGVYYDGEASLDTAALCVAAGRLDDARRPDLIGPPGSWGPWVNAGGWLTVEGWPVDIILRDMRRVAKAVSDCSEGHITAHYQPGHPHAYLNAMYMGELAVCRVLHDPTGGLEAIRRRTRPYPRGMKRAMVERFLFEAGFSRMLALKSAGGNDPYYLMAHIIRSISCLNQVLFAINETYCINEKRAVHMIGGFLHKPAAYPSRVQGIIAMCAVDAGQACALLEALIGEIEAMAG